MPVASRHLSPLVRSAGGQQNTDAITPICGHRDARRTQPARREETRPRSGTASRSGPRTLTRAPHPRQARPSELQVIKAKDPQSATPHRRHWEQHRCRRTPLTCSASAHNSGATAPRPPETSRDKAATTLAMPGLTTTSATPFEH
jgi:hypothetical protein